jgi:RimJ/RimL family protein N-acetyltransferase
MTFTCIDTERLRLRRFQASDLPTLIAYRNDPQVARFQSWQLTEENDLRAAIEHWASIDPDMPGSGFQLAVELRETTTHIGDCFFKRLDYDDRQAEIGYTLALEHQGYGFGTEMVLALIEYAFVSLGLHRVIALTDCENMRSAALMERVGMRREGHFRQSFFNKGSWRDEYQYALLHSEWLASLA